MCWISDASIPLIDNTALTAYAATASALFTACAAYAAMASARVSKNILADLERPWLFVEGIKVRRRDSSRIPNNWFLSLEWKNIGRAPAIIEECTFKIVDKSSLLATPDYSGCVKLACPMSLAVGGTFATDEAGPTPGMDVEKVFYGQLIYKELNGKTHSSGFAVAVSPHMPAATAYSNRKYHYYT